MLSLDGLKIEKLRVFLEVAQGQATSKHVSYRTSRRYIQSIEKHLGYPLFNGYRRPANLTKEGKRLLYYTEKIIKEVDKFYSP